MHWVAPSEKDIANGTLEKRLWDTADQFRANLGFKAQYDFLLNLPEAENICAKGNAASAAPMAEQALTPQRQTQNLRRTRDLLLPRLLSGDAKLVGPPFRC